MAEVETLPDIDYDGDPDALAIRHSRISGLFARFVELATGGSRDAGGIIPRMDLESLVNTVAMTLNITIEQKQDLLELDDVFQRCDILSAILFQQVETLGLIRRFEHLKPDNPHFN
jgi:Lon protease-like protein